MDSNKNEQCCYNTNISTTATNRGRVGGVEIIETGCIAKTVSAAKYQNQFNNNNLVEQENRMRAVKEDEPSSAAVSRAVGRENGGPAGTVVASEMHPNERAFTVNGSIFPPSPSSSSPSSPAVFVARNASEDRVPSGQQNVECLTNTTTTSSSFTAPAINGTAGAGYNSRPPANSTIPDSLARSSNADQHHHNHNHHHHHHFDPSATIDGGGLLGCDRAKDEPSSVETTTVAKPVKPPDDAPAADDGDFSDNNSIGNLSYISENGLIEEIILLPNNAYSDDDNASTSDDCIYAYRGGEEGGAAGLLLELRGDQPPDDETDFLEMDFDPEPSSEMENFDSSQREPAFEEDGLAAAASSSSGRSNEPHPLPPASTSPRLIAAHVRTLSPHSIPQADAQVEPTQQVAVVAGSPQQLDGSVRDEQRTHDVESAVTLSPRHLSPPGPSAPVEEKKVEKIHDTGGGGGGVGGLQQQLALEYSADRSQAHKTGAIPKAVPHHYPSNGKPGHDDDRTLCGRGSSNAKNLKLDLNLCLDGIGSAGGDGEEEARRHYFDQMLYYEPQTAYRGHGGTWADKLVDVEAGNVRKDEDIEFYCSECGNVEFSRHHWKDHEPAASSWMCKNCALAQNKRQFSRRRWAEEVHSGSAQEQQSSSELHRSEEDAAFDLRAEQLALEALSKINTLKEMPPSSGGQLSESDELQYVRIRTSKYGAATNQRSQRPQDQEVPNPDYHKQGVGSCPENSVTIYTINCGELTIIEALTRIGISPNLEALRQYFIEQYEVDTSKMNIPQYLLHMSKRDCNYKKVIEAIKSCCDDETLDVQYYPLDPFSEMPEIVQVSSYEIAKRWNANTNLRQIIHFKHKHFHTLNVLGKIVNIIRQPSRGRHTTHMIGIPQYYKSGCITITRSS